MAPHGGYSTPFMMKLSTHFFQNLFIQALKSIKYIKPSALLEDAHISLTPSSHTLKWRSTIISLWN
jgi:hypothetical protein